MGRGCLAEGYSIQDEEDNMHESRYRAEGLRRCFPKVGHLNRPLLMVKLNNDTVKIDKDRTSGSDSEF